MVARLVLVLSLALLFAAGAPAGDTAEPAGEAAELIADLDGAVGEPAPLGDPPIARPGPSGFRADAIPSSPWLDRVFRPPRVLVSSDR